MKTSYSALNTFESCPLRYKYQEIDRIKTPKGPEAVFGTLIHNTLNFIHSGSFLLPKEKEALNYFSVNWNADIFEDEITERAAFAQGVQIIQDYYRRNNPEKAKIVALESRFSIELEGSSQEEDLHKVSGFIDRIDKTDDGYEIIDYKTSSKLPSQEVIDQNQQLFIYLLAFLRRYPKQEKNLDKIKLSLYFVKHGVKLSTTKTKNQLEEGKKRIVELIDEIGESDFPPLVSPLCDWCGYQKICPMWSHKFKKIITTSDEDKALIIEEYVSLQDELKLKKIRIKELQEELLEIMKKEQVDRLFGKNRIISRSTRRSFSWEIEKIKPILEREGRWEDILIVSSPKLNKLIETLPSFVRKELVDAKKEKETQSLSVKKFNNDN